MQPPQHVVLRLKLPAPRFALLAGWEACDDTTALSRLSDPNTAPFGTLLIPPDLTTNLSPLPGRGMTGTVQRVAYRSGAMELKTVAAGPTILRVSEKYDPNWKAWVDGQPVPVLRVDYIFQGVALPAGQHEVRLRFAPAIWPLAVQVAGMLLMLGAALYLIFKKMFSK